MKLLLSAARPTGSSLWICRSCRGRGIKYASTSAPLSTAAQQLRTDGPARTRFAPSPTGYLHLGSLRTALFNYLVARATGGQFLLRIEDTDQKRTVPDAEERLYQDLEWAGIEWDEGPNIGGPYGPYKQSERTALYREHAWHLLHSGHAYRCFCSPEDLNNRAKHRAALGLPPDYDRKCAHIPKEESDDRAAKGDAHVIRLLTPDKYPVFKDLVYGLVRQRKDFTTRPKDQSFDDPILLKTDGFPTYHLANVVDDHMMNITHVIRGSEWMSSTHKHLAMYEAFGWTPPQFAHVGLLLDKDRQKLSKRLESMSMTELRDKKGIFPETLTNFVALLGWSHNVRSDVMSMEDLIKNASLKFTKGDTVVSLEKLWFLQKRHAARYASLQPPKPSNPSHDLEELAVKPILKFLDNSASHQPDRFPFYNALPEGEARFNFVRSIVWADAQNYTDPEEFISRNNYFFVSPTAEELASNAHHIKLHNVPSDLTHTIPSSSFLLFFQNIGEIPEQDWNKAVLKSWITSIVDQGSMMSIGELRKEEKGSEELEALVKKAWAKLVHGYIRWAIMAGRPGPDGSEIMRILGRQECLRRLDAAGKVLLAREEEESVVAKDGVEAGL